MPEREGNFDDSELEDIMREMEELEKEGQSSLKEISADSEGRSRWEGPSRLESAVGRSPEHWESGEATTCARPQSPPNALRLNISGQMELQLYFDSCGHRAKITIFEGKGLEIETESGAKFILPFDIGPKKVA